MKKFFMYGLMGVCCFSFYFCLFYKLAYYNLDGMVMGSDLIVLGHILLIFVYHSLNRSHSIVAVIQDFLILNVCWGLMTCMSFIGDSSLGLTSTTGNTFNAIFSSGVIWLGVLIFFLLYVDVQNELYVVHRRELPFIIMLLIWVFVVAVKCYNFMFLFVLMEIITLLIIIAGVMYVVMNGVKVIRALVHFFVLNLLISAFYLLGVGLLLYLVEDGHSGALMYSSLLDMYTSYLEWDAFELRSLFIYMKMVLMLMIFPLLFKLTLAPYSIWIARVYGELPWVILFILMTIYKLVYVVIFMNIFVKIIDLMPNFSEFWTWSVMLFVIPSMFIGCLAYSNSNLKIFFAYTTVSQVSYVVGALLVRDFVVHKYAFLYLMIYIIQIFAIVGIFIHLQRRFNITHLSQLAFVRLYSPFYYWALFILILSLSGVPPFIGFFMKYLLFVGLYKQGAFMLAIMGLVSNFFMTIVYLQLAIQLIYVKPDLYKYYEMEHTKLGEQNLMPVQNSPLSSKINFIMMGVVGLIVCGVSVCGVFVFLM